MPEDDANWFSKWHEDLPSPDELMPLSQSLISPDLALAFNISTPQIHPPPNSSAEFDSPELSGPAGATGTGSGSDEPARTLKRPRLVWTPQLHKRFVDAVAHLGIKNAVPKTIMQLMSVDGLTRENVASHLQKYRLYLKRMQGISNGGGNSSAVVSDSATDHLFASSPVPAHFLHPARSNSEHFFVPMQHHHPQLQHQFRHFGNSGPNSQFEHPFLRQSQQQQQMHRIGTSVAAAASPAAYVEDLESVNGRRVLTLFPTADD